eukprot:gene6649-6501_t
MQKLTEQAPQFIRAIAPYKAGKPVSDVVRELGLDPNTVVKLASNENPLGLGEKAKAAIAQAATDLGRYPDANGFSLKAKLAALFIANPNNPTGTFLPQKKLLDFLKQVPSNVLVVLDEAYNEFLKPEDQYDSTQWVAQFPNLLVSRSFSKAYGLAALRVGYGICSAQIADVLNRVRQPFNVNSLALAAACAALADSDYLA